MRPRLEPDLQPPLDGHAHRTERETALGVHLRVLADGRDDRVHEHAVLAVDRADENRRRMPTCVAASPTPSASCMRSIIRSLTLRSSSSNVLDLVGAHAQHGVAVLADLRERDLLADEPLGLGLRLRVGQLVVLVLVS